MSRASSGGALRYRCERRHPRERIRRHPSEADREGTPPRASGAAARPAVFPPGADRQRAGCSHALRPLNGDATGPARLNRRPVYATDEATEWVRCGLEAANPASRTREEQSQQHTGTQPRGRQTLRGLRSGLRRSSARTKALQVRQGGGATAKGKKGGRRPRSCAAKAHAAGAPGAGQRRHGQARPRVRR